MQQPRIRCLRPASLAAALCLALGLMMTPGCSGWATYPPIEGATQLGHPKLEPVPTIMAEAVRYAHNRYVRTDEIIFNLPEGTPPEIYDSVILRLGGNARPLLEPGTPAVHVNAVRVRALEAQADVVYPRPDGHYELVTLYMRQKFLHKYEIRDTRLWRIQVTPPQPRYEPAPVDGNGDAEPAADESGAADAPPETNADGDAKPGA